MMGFQGAGVNRLVRLQGAGVNRLVGSIGWWGFRVQGVNKVLGLQGPGVQTGWWASRVQGGQQGGGASAQGSTRWQQNTLCVWCFMLMIQTLLSFRQMS